MAPIKTMHLITELDRGGAETALLRFLTHQNRTRYRPFVVCLYNGDGSVARQIQALGIDVIDLGMKRPYRIDALYRLYRLLQRKRPSILHCWLFHADLIGRLIGRLARVPIVVTSRRGTEIGGMWREQAKRFTRSLDDRIITVCTTARQQEIRRTKADPEKVVTIYNGIDTMPPVTDQVTARLRRTLKLPDNSKIVLCIARLAVQKGHADLLTAWEAVQAVHPDAHLLIVGDGEQRTGLTRTANQRAGCNTIHFIGRREDVPDLLAMSDLVVLPTRGEGLPNVLLEAMAAGRPVVATNVGGIPELVIDGTTGLLVPPSNPDALSRMIITLLSDPERARIMGHAGRERVAKHFPIGTMVKRTETLYTELLQSKLSLHYS
jgi:glycosyltransferase involved in cell wall biosynthesis